VTVVPPAPVELVPEPSAEEPFSPAESVAPVEPEL